MSSCRRRRRARRKRSRSAKPRDRRRHDVCRVRARWPAHRRLLRTAGRRSGFMTSFSSIRAKGPDQARGLRSTCRPANGCSLLRTGSGSSGSTEQSWSCSARRSSLHACVGFVARCCSADICGDASRDQRHCRSNHRRRHPQADAGERTRRRVRPTCHNTKSNARPDRRPAGKSATGVERRRARSANSARRACESARSAASSMAAIPRQLIEGAIGQVDDVLVVVRGDLAHRRGRGRRNATLLSAVDLTRD